MVVPENLKDFITSPARLKVWEAISSFDKDFTIKDIVNYLKTQKFHYTEANISMVLKALCLRGFLTQHEERSQIRRGAFSIRYIKTKAKA